MRKRRANFATEVQKNLGPGRPCQKVDVPSCEVRDWSLCGAGCQAPLGGEEAKGQPDLVAVCGGVTVPGAYARKSSMTPLSVIYRVERLADRSAESGLYGEI